MVPHFPKINPRYYSKIEEYDGKYRQIEFKIVKQFCKNKFKIQRSLNFERTSFFREMYFRKGGI